VDSRQTTAPSHFGQVGLAGWVCKSLPGLLRLHRSSKQVVEHREIVREYCAIQMPNPYMGIGKAKGAPKGVFA